MATDTLVHRLDLGYFVRSAAEAGGPHPRVEPALAYLERPAGFDPARVLFAHDCAVWEPSGR